MRDEWGEGGIGGKDGSGDGESNKTSDNHGEKKGGTTAIVSYARVIILLAIRLVCLEWCKPWSPLPRQGGVSEERERGQDSRNFVSTYGVLSILVIALKELRKRRKSQLDMDVRVPSNIYYSLILLRRGWKNNTSNNDDNTGTNNNIKYVDNSAANTTVSKNDIKILILNSNPGDPGQDSSHPPAE